MRYIRETLDALTGKYGSPLYVFDEESFIENYRKLYFSMRSKYENYNIAYSFKTNYAPYICQIVKELGGYAEVVSLMEYNLAKKIGFSDERIIFNGPVKTGAGIIALNRGSIVNADNLAELELMCEAAKEAKRDNLKIGIRVNINVGQDFVSRFGIHENDMEKAFLLAQKYGVKIAGLHCHISRARGLDAWLERTESILRISDRFMPEGPDFIDLGSGMYGEMDKSLAEQFDYIPSYEQYAEVTAEIISKHFREENRPLFFTEPGTTLISSYMECIGVVEGIKEIDNHWFAVLNCSTHNLGETCVLKRLPVSVVSAGKKQRKYDSIDLTGYTCLEQDVMLPGFSGILAEGDYVIFGNVGGYSNVFKPPFINPNCAIVSRKGNDYTIIKTAETEEDLLHTYKFKG